jgi:hypothetical protein
MKVIQIIDGVQHTVDTMSGDIVNMKNNSVVGNVYEVQE